VLQKRLNASAAANIKVEAKRKLRRLWLLGPFGKAAQGFEPSHARDRLHSDASRDETTARLLLRKGILFHDIVQPRLDEERVQIIAILCTLQADYNGTMVQWHKDTLTVLANAEVQATVIHVTLQSSNVRICEEHAQIFMLPTHLHVQHQDQQRSVDAFQQLWHPRQRDGRWPSDHSSWPDRCQPTPSETLQIPWREVSLLKRARPTEHHIPLNETVGYYPILLPAFISALYKSYPSPIKVLSQSYPSHIPTLSQPYHSSIPALAQPYPSPSPTVALAQP
jgi:hypothetical protein